MRTGQKNYIANRIKQISCEKLEQAKKKFTTGKELTNLEMYNLVKSGKVDLKPFDKQNTYDLRNGELRYDFSNFGEVLDEKAYNKFKESLGKEQQKAMDSIMLGDAKEALDILKSFENLVIK